ncbi:MAG: single-stranded DNA-binding protein [Candidatus Nanopelagicales bacterium]
MAPSKTVYLWVSAWRQLGENVAASLALGQPMAVVGKLRQSTYEKDGVAITSLEVEAEVGRPRLARGTTAFVRTPRGPQTADLAAERETVVIERSEMAA